MKIIFANRPVGYSYTGWIEGTIIDSSNPARKRVQVANNRIFSLQPSVTGFAYSNRPLDADGAYEQVLINADLPVGSNGTMAVQPDLWAVIPFVVIG